MNSIQLPGTWITWTQIQNKDQDEIFQNSEVYIILGTGKYTNRAAQYTKKRQFSGCKNFIVLHLKYNCCLAIYYFTAAL